MTNRRGAPKKNKNPMIGERIKQARKGTQQNGKTLTQAELADALQVTLRTIQNWESGKNEPSDEMIRLIAEICNVSIDWLHGLDVPTIIEMSRNILKNFNPSKGINIAPQLIEKHRTWAIEWYPIVVSLLEYFDLMDAMKNTKDFYKFSLFMEEQIKHSIETYMKYSNDNEREEIT